MLPRLGIHAAPENACGVGVTITQPRCRFSAAPGPAFGHFFHVIAIGANPRPTSQNQQAEALGFFPASMKTSAGRPLIAVVDARGYAVDARR